jgi:hypothetical protein
MKRCLAVSLLLLTISAVAYSQEHSQPTASAPPNKSAPIEQLTTTFNSDLGRFSILMPTTPTESISKTESEHGPYTSYTYIAKGQSVYAIGWVDYDPSFNFNRIGELEANRDNLIKGLKATLVSTKTLTLDGYQAIEFTAETAEQSLKSRVYLVGRRPYQLLTVTKKGLDDSNNTDHFFASFKIRPQ